MQEPPSSQCPAPQRLPMHDNAPPCTTHARPSAPCPSALHPDPSPCTTTPPQPCSPPMHKSPLSQCPAHHAPNAFHAPPCTPHAPPSTNVDRQNAPHALLCSQPFAPSNAPNASRLPKPQRFPKHPCTTQHSRRPPWTAPLTPATPAAEVWAKCGGGETAISVGNWSCRGAALTSAAERFHCYAAFADAVLHSVLPSNLACIAMLPFTSTPSPSPSLHPVRPPASLSPPFPAFLSTTLS